MAISEAAPAGFMSAAPVRHAEDLVNVHASQSGFESCSRRGLRDVGWGSIMTNESKISC